MLSKEIQSLETENRVLREALQELKQKMNSNEVLKPRSCQYCKNYVQHYAKGGIPYRDEYVPIYAGHCTRGVPISKGGKKRPKPDETCPYFEIGSRDMKMMGVKERSENA